MLKLRKRLLFLVALLFGVAGQLGEKAVSGKAPESRLESRPKDQAVLDSNSVTFHYHRSDSSYSDYDLWIWGTGENGAAHALSQSDDFGKYAVINLSNYRIQTEINVLIRQGGGSWTRQSSDLNIQLSDYTPIGTMYHVYLVNMESEVFASAEDALKGRVTAALFKNEREITATTNNEPETYKVLEGLTEIKTGNVTWTKNSDGYSYDFKITLPSDFIPAFDKDYEVEVKFKNSADTATRKVGLDGLFDSELFESKLVYNGKDLGNNYSQTETTFKAWSPFSTDLKLRIYDNGTPVDVDATLGSDEYAEYDMVKGDKGVWSYTLSGDLHGKYYTYVVTNEVYTNKETADPYTRAAGVNGRRGMIVDFSKTNPVGWEDVSLVSRPATEQITYEVHVADFTGDATWNGSEANRMKFLGLIEEGTTYTENGVTVTTGFDHLKELGVNAVQILPFYDQDNDETSNQYNWGYNPHLYNVLDGIYSSNPHDGLVRIKEFKEVVKKFSEHDIRIVMDVVYNHVASVSGNALNIMAPKYYFRHNAAGGLSNGTGVGNDTMSERAMFTNFMVDSTTFLAREYKLSGYRFDLMGYHTIDAMNAVSRAVREINPDFVLHGEPWKPYGGIAPVTPVNVPDDFAYYDNLTKLEHIAGFSDSARDNIIGRVPFGNGRTQGYVHDPLPDGNLRVKKHMSDVLLGKFSEYGSGRSVHDDPLKTVNYVSCHDNFTLYDKVRLGAQEGFAGQEERIKQMSLQAQSFILLGQGLPFIHAGSEMLRSKEFTASTPEIIALLGSDQGDYKPGIEPDTYICNNSYKWPIEINSIKWDLKVKNYFVFEAYKKMIELRLNNHAFTYTTREDIDANVKVTWGSEFGQDDTIIKYETKDSNNEFVIYFVGATQRATLDVDGLYVVLDTSGNLEEGKRLSGSYKSTGGSFTLILSKNPVATTPSKPNTGLIVGLSIGIPLALIASGLTIFLVLRKRKEAIVQ